MHSKRSDPEVRALAGRRRSLSLPGFARLPARGARLRRVGALLAVAAVGAYGGAAGSSAGPDTGRAVAGVGQPAGCSSAGRGRPAPVELSRGRYPHIVGHIERSWAAGYPRVLRVNRAGSKQRRDRLLSWWQRSHPQPKGDRLDLDEAPAATLRASWRADVLPVAEHENRAAGSVLGHEIAGLCNGSYVVYRFTR